jgi:hypothetical protein
VYSELYQGAIIALIFRDKRADPSSARRRGGAPPGASWPSARSRAYPYVEHRAWPAPIIAARHRVARDASIGPCYGPGMVGGGGISMGPVRHLIAGLACMVAGCLATDLAAASWTTGGITFSDELGGVRLLAATGTGTRDDPIILVEEITGAGPAVLVIRNGRTGHLNVSPALGLLRLAVVNVVVNRGPWAWSGFDLELRRTPDQPSVYTDGLSFDQPQSFARTAKADRFAQSQQDDEPFDRIRFDRGNVDAEGSLRLDFDIVDVNGSAVFYLVQRPVVLFAWRDRSPAPQWVAFLDRAP